MVRSTGTRNLTIALRRAQEFLDDYERKVVGLSKYEGYTRPVNQFLPLFLKSLDSSEKRKTQLDSQLDRAFHLLRIEKLSDMEKFTPLQKKLLKLEGTGPGQFARKTLIRSFKSPLKQFSATLIIKTTT